MKSYLAEIVIQNIEFFGLAPDSEVHPDAAVRQLEIIASLLKELPEAELNSFVEVVQMRLERLRNEGASQEQLEFLKRVPEHLGIGD